jgi:hypothetical protein
MSIVEFIRDKLLLPRLIKYGVLVVYDPERRYRDLCLSLADDGRQLVDTTESGIESRFAALRALKDLGSAQSKVKSLLVYVPAGKPITPEQKQADPFALYTECGAVFPEDDGDEFENICLRAKPDYATEIRRIFAQNPSPSFEVVDAVGGGLNWPQLRATLKADSARDILAALLAPSPEQVKDLKAQEGWSEEARELLRVALGMDLKTRAKNWSPIADELWRFLLFSEFVFDLPGELPAALATVPRAPVEAQRLIEDICDGLRNNIQRRAHYVEKAEAVEKELNLPEVCHGMEDLGVRDTFPFEERTFLRRAIYGLIGGDLDEARVMLGRHRNSVWLGKGESQTQWALVQSAMALIEACEGFEEQLPERSRTQSDLLDFYTGSLREADRLQREFEQSVGEYLDSEDLLGDVIKEARGRYRRLAVKVQAVFVKHLETTGWPPPGRLANAAVFDRFIGERLKGRDRKVAYFMIDALRYELGVALEKLISDDGLVELHAAYAQLPSVTPVGMASLLPGAQNDLYMDRVGDSLAPKLASAPVTNVTQRMDVLKKQFGDRFYEISLSEFARKKAKLQPTVDLLVLRSTEIDSHLESNPETTLGLTLNTLKLIRVALHKLRDLGFNEAIIATDHGFFLNAQAEAGDVCKKPQGNWPVVAHDRLMLGDGAADAHNFVLPAERLGVRGAFSQCAGPRSMAPYRAGHLYFHGGASLAEAVVPVLAVKLEAAVAPERQNLKIELSYKGGAKKITTLLPVVEVAVFSDDLFTQGTEVEILLEAQDEKGNVVGEPRPGGDVNPATRTVSLLPGARKLIVLRMDEDFRGKFTIKALNPTTLTAYGSLGLETDYME